MNSLPTSIASAATARAPHPFRWGIALTLTLLACAGTVAAPAADAEPVGISEGTLIWRFKHSWTQYVGQGTLSGGATVGPEWDSPFEFPITSGSYDPDTKTTTISASGTVHWQKYQGHQFPPPAGYTGSLDDYLLDVKFSNPQLTIGSAGSELTVEAVVRDRDTWELIDHGRIPLVELDPTGVVPVIADDTTTWMGIPAFLTEDGRLKGFGGSYNSGQRFDDVTFSYTGPGGAPDLGEHWTAPNTTGLALRRNTILSPATTNQFKLIWSQPDAGLVHYTDAGLGLQAFDLRTGEKVGAPAAWTSAFSNSISILDSNAGTAFYRSAGSSTTLDAYMRWNDTTNAYESSTIPASTVRTGRFLWDADRERAFALALIVPAGVGSTDYENHVWTLFAYTRQPGGSFAEQRYTLPSGTPGWNRRWYGSITEGAVLADGSLILMPGFVNTPGSPPPESIAVPRVVLHPDTGTVTTTSVPGASIPFDEYADNRYDVISTGEDDHLTLAIQRAGSGAVTRVRQYRLTEEGALEQVGDVVELPATYLAQFALDPEDGTLWTLLPEVQQIWGARDGRPVGGHFLGFAHTKNSADLAVTENHGVVVVSSDGNPPPLGSSPHGFAVYDWTGYSPEIANQPNDDGVTVAVGGSGQVSFSAAATGTPQPTVQWQRRAPGSTRFVDVPEGTGTTLDAEVSAADDGAAYRAVFTNTAGALATDAAEVDVSYAPSIAFDPVDQQVVEGEDATFELLSTGSPAPAIVWQRRVGGFWQAIDLDSGDFEVGGNNLVVKDVNAEMSGSLFRAKVSNTVATVYSAAAELSVVGEVAEPVAFGSGHLDWGFANRWRCYVVGSVAQGGIDVAGGVTRVPGTAATGSLCPGAGTGSEVLRFPVRGGSYDPVAGDLVVKLDGSVRFWGHAHHAPGGVPQLDTTFSNLRLVASDGTGILYADATGATMESPAPVMRKDVALVSVDLSGPAPRSAGIDWGASPTVLSATGAQVFGSYPAGEPFDPISMSLVYGTPRPDPVPVVDPPPGAKPEVKGIAARIAAAPRRARIVGSKRLARLVTLTCPAGRACRVTTPARVRIRIAGRSYRPWVLAPRTLRPGRRATVRILLSRQATRRLAGRSAKVRLRVAVTANGTRTVRTVRVTIRAKAPGKGTAAAR